MSALVFGIYAIGALSGSVPGSIASPELASLNSAFLNDELAQISIELLEIEYAPAVDNTIATALDEISYDSVAHLNRDILFAEEALLDDDFSRDTEIDELLDSLL